MLHIDIAQFEFKPTGGNTDGAPESVLSGAIVIGGIDFHVEAIQVDMDDNGSLTAVNPQYESNVEAVYGLADDNSLTPVEIDGLPYVLSIFPHS